MEHLKYENSEILNLVKDDLEWTSFYENSDLNISNFPSKVGKFNRLIMHTNNLFLIAGYGAFNEGYTMIIPKKLISSFGHLDKDLLNEFNWFKNFTKKILSEIYVDYKIAIFEHGLCACLGGLDRAHLHFMPYKKMNKDKIINAINLSLKRRRIGNQVIKFKNYELTDPDDIDFFLSKAIKDKEYTILGKQFVINDIKSNYLASEYPLNIHNEVVNNNPYILFDSGNNDSSFITFIKIETQFGREIVFNIDYRENNSMESLIKTHNLKSLENKFYWRWQDYNFDLNIIKTIKTIGTYLDQNYKNIRDNNFNLQSFN